MGRAAADAVNKSLLSLSSSSNVKEMPCVIYTAGSAKVKNVGKDENALLNVTANWKHVSYIAGGIIESISESNAKKEKEKQWKMVNLVTKNITVGFQLQIQLFLNTVKHFIFSESHTDFFIFYIFNNNI